MNYRLILMLFVWIILSSWSAEAEDIYVAQTASGDGSGSDASNTQSLSWLNTAASWAVGSGKVSPGDTVHLVGIFTSSLTIQGSGTSGSPITIQLEPGAKFTAPTWNKSGANGDAAIYGSRISYVSIRGNGSPNSIDIESTANGTGLTYSNQSAGVWCDSCDHITVELLTITNMYRRTANSTDNNQVGLGIKFASTGSDITIRSNRIWQASLGSIVSVRSNLFVYNNFGGDCGEGVFVIGPPSSGFMTNVLIYGNTFYHTATWAGQPNIHENCMHIYAVATGSRLDGLRVYGNEFSGTMGGTMTAMLFIEGYVYAPQVYDNLFLPLSTTYGGNGYLTLKGATNALVANNTWIGKGVGTAIGTTGFGGGMDGGHVYTNNLINSVQTMVSDPDRSMLACDYNCYWPDSSAAFEGFRTFSQWKSAFGVDAHSKMQLASLDAGFVPTPSDTAARAQGVNLTGVFTTDFNGNARPSTGNWSIGAFESAVSGTPSLAVTPSSQVFGSLVVGQTSDLSFSVQNTGSGTLSGSASVAAPFSIVSGGSYALGAGQSQAVTVRYSPTVPGSNSQLVTFSGAATVTALVSGVATAPASPSIGVSPPSQNFGSVPVGATADLGFTVQNTGSGTLTGTASVPAPFSITSGGAYSLAAGQTQTVTVRYAPTAAVNDTQTVTFTGAAGASTTVLGTGAAGGPLSFQAASATITPPFALTNGYIYQPIQTAAVSNAGVATFNFTLTNAGSYEVQVLVNAPGDANNSFFVNIDALPQDPTMIWDIFPFTSGFEQRTVSWRGNGTDVNNQFIPKVFNLAAGPHELYFCGRESNVQLESLTLVQLPQPPQNLRVVGGP